MTKNPANFSNEAELNFDLQLQQIFKQGSQTYFYSSWFFPPEVRSQVNILYAFVRTADDLVDSIPADPMGFFKFKNYYLDQKFNPVACQSFEQIKESESSLTDLALTSKTNFFSQSPAFDLALHKSEVGDRLPADDSSSINLFHRQIIDRFIDLERELQFEPSWTLAFLESMESDLEPPVYQNLVQTQKYIYGSANVIGLFMARILDLPVESHYFAEHLGMSFQYINFLRDVAEDLTLGRSYFPQDLLQSCQLKSLNYAETSQKPTQFAQLVHQIHDQYMAWQRIAEQGFGYFPKKYRVAIKTASDMYQWTGRQIVKNPFIVYQKKIKPRKRQVLLTGASNWLR